MTLLDHFSELRKRLFVVFIGWVVGAAVAYTIRFYLLDWIRAPLPDEVTLTFFSVLEPFSVSMAISAFFGLVIISPLIIGQLWGFVAPGLYRTERRYAVPFIFFAALAFVSGVAFAYFVVMPFTIPILLGFLGTQAVGMLSIGQYVSNMLVLMGIFGLMFEMPVLGYLFAKLGLISAQFLTQHRRWAIVIGLILAAIITPTGDPFNMGLVAVPLLGLYELTIWVARFAGRQSTVEHAREDPELTNRY